MTAAILDKASPLRQYLDAEFPNRRVLQAAYRAGRGPLIVGGGDANPGTLGAAFDFTVRIDSVGCYSARYGRLTTWPLSDFLTDLGGRVVTLPAERERVWRLLGGDAVDSGSPEAGRL